MFAIGDRVVYPMHGAGVIESIEEKKILGETRSYYILHIPHGNMQTASLRVFAASWTAPPSTTS